MTLAIGGVLAITSGRKQRHGAEGGEEKEVPFRLLSAEEKALELRRQRRSSAAPVAGPFAAHSSFRRDDRIHTDFRAHVLDTASEMAAGEHLAAAYRLRDSVGANATLAAGLRRFSHAAGKAPGGGAFCRTSSAAAPCELDSIALAGLRGSAAREALRGSLEAESGILVLQLDSRGHALRCAHSAVLRCIHCARSPSYSRGALKTLGNTVFPAPRLADSPRRLPRSPQISPYLPPEAGGLTP